MKWLLRCLQTQAISPTIAPVPRELPDERIVSGLGWLEVEVMAALGAGAGGPGGGESKQVSNEEISSALLSYWPPPS